MFLWSQRPSVFNSPGRTGREGNVLFLVLIGVALFAALSYIVTSSSRTGGTTPRKEKVSLIASDLMQYAAQIGTAIERIRISTSTPEWGFDFYRPRVPSLGNDSCTSEKCRVFSPRYGAIFRRLYRDNSLPDANSSVNHDTQIFLSASVLDIGTSEPELVVAIGWLTREICQYINYKSGASPSLNSPVPNENHGAAIEYVGTLNAFPSSPKVFGVTNPQFRGKYDFCYYHNGSSGWYYTYVHVLMVR